MRGIIGLVLALACQVAWADNCKNSKNDFDGLYCLMKVYMEADRELNETYTELLSVLSASEEAVLKKSQLAWIQERNFACGLKQDGKFYADLECATRMTRSQVNFLRERLRECRADECRLAEPAAAVPPKTPGRFTASYYRNSHLVATEEVERPSINYAWSEFHDIKSEDFRAVWEGDVPLGENEKVLTVNFDLSWSDVALYIDDKLMQQWSNDNKEAMFSLPPGKHKVKIEYANHWHTVGFNASFASYPKLPASAAVVVLSKLVSKKTRVVYLGAYEAGSLYNEITVRLPKSKRSAFLFLASYHAVNWIIDNPASSPIAGIAVKSYGPGSTVSNAGDAPIYNIFDLLAEHKPNNKVASEVARIAGKQPEVVLGDYSPSHFTVPAQLE